MLLALHKLCMTLIGVAGIAFLIGFHELGHFLFCKLFGIKTPTFSIGFGPQLLAKKIGDTVFTLSAIPLGGYVEIAGYVDSPEGTSSPSNSHATNEKQYFNQKPFYQQLCVMLGGIAFNLIFAYIAFTVLFMSGLPNSPFLAPTNSNPIVRKVIPGSSAEAVGIQEGDHIIAINNQPAGDNVVTIATLLQESATPTVTVERSGSTLDFTLPASQVPSSAKPRMLGVLFESKEIPPASSFGEAVKKGISLTNTYIRSTVNGYLSLFQRRNVGEVSGPLMIISSMGNQAAKGAKDFFIFLAIISVNLAVLNLIPLPILDGGQILFFSMEAMVKHKQKIQIATWILLLGLILYVSAKEIYFFTHDYIELLKTKMGL